MIISRTGAAANHGSRSITLNNFSYAWQVGNETMLGKSDTPIRDFATDSRHRYRLTMNLEEISLIIEALAKSCTEIDSDKLKQVLRPKVADLLKIANMASNT